MNKRFVNGEYYTDDMDDPFRPGVDDQYYPVEVFDEELQKESVEDILRQNGYDYKVHVDEHHSIYIRIGYCKGYYRYRDTNEDYQELVQQAERVMQLFQEHFEKVYLFDDWHEDDMFLPDANLAGCTVSVQLIFPKKMNTVYTLGGRIPSKYASVHKSFNSMVKSIRNNRISKSNVFEVGKEYYSRITYDGYQHNIYLCTAHTDRTVVLENTSTHESFRRRIKDYDGCEWANISDYEWTTSDKEVEGKEDWLADESDRQFYYPVD